jgi:hypothetical protein
VSIAQISLKKLLGIAVYINKSGCLQYSHLKVKNLQFLAIADFKTIQERWGFVAYSPFACYKVQKNCYPFTATSCAIATVLTAAIPHQKIINNMQLRNEVKIYLEIHLHNNKSNDLPSTTLNPTLAFSTRNCKGLNVSSS